ncbi:protein-tyrosine phosphatase [Dyella sp. OK004]|uniref:low molecular weight protein-tyrosine-phosphatase n=1 Tax=Dyella sp. OK004 TaxID=1855292 RepID=UPI0008E8C63C|nr:low molecular weight protein-tyrosine-phosphatase [Dyella sp. OK004]SFS14749.1 protein-tyrosine phosphatase [Dyella sp. OK004]
MSASRLLFVCLGNICRSPLVEAVARRRCAEVGLDVMVASCGTGSWHVGKGADARMRRAAEAAGFDLSGHRARQFQQGDLEAFDLVLAMDRDNLYGVERLVTPRSSAEIGLFLEWAASAPPAEFPDPYYGEEEGFTEAVALAERGVAGLIRRLRSR